MVALNRFEGYPRRRWPLPTDPSGPPMAYPEPMPTYMTPPATTAPPAPMAQAPAAPTDTAYPPTGFQEPQQAPETSPEDDEFDRQIQEEQAEADWTRMTNRATAVLKVEADMQKARNALAEAKQKAMQRPSAEAPTEPLNKVFNRYVKGHAPMPTLEEYKAAVRRPAPTEVLGWTGRTGAPSGPGYRSYLEQGGTPEELEGITEENYRRALRENAPSPYIAPSGPDVRTLQRHKAEEYLTAPEIATKRQKGLGYFGELKRPGGGVSTELSIGVNIEGKETEIPSLVPTLTKAEIDYLLAGNKPTEEIVQKAVLHAKQRIAEGKSPFAQAMSEGHRERLTKWAGDFATEFERNRELVRRQREHREATMAPIREKLASISERRKELRRERKAPTGWDIMRHKEEVARIKTGEPTEEAPRYPRGHKLTVIDHEIQDAQGELETLIEERAGLTEIITAEAGWWESDKEEAAKARAAEIDPRIATLQEKITRLQKEARGTAGLAGGSKLTEDEARQILTEAGGDKEKARQIARQRGYNF